MLHANFDKWQQSTDQKRRDASLRSPAFERELLLSAAVEDPGQVEKDPDDEVRKPDGNGTGLTPTLPNPGTGGILRNPVLPVSPLRP